MRKVRSVAGFVRARRHVDKANLDGRVGGAARDRASSLLRTRAVLARLSVHPASLVAGRLFLTQRRTGHLLAFIEINVKKSSGIESAHSRLAILNRV
jgi:hypothetical protein